MDVGTISGKIDKKHTASLGKWIRLFFELIKDNIESSISWDNGSHETGPFQEEAVITITIVSMIEKIKSLKSIRMYIIEFTRFNFLDFRIRFN